MRLCRRPGNGDRVRRICRARRTRGDSSVDRRGAGNPPESGRRGSPRGAAPPTRDEPAHGRQAGTAAGGRDRRRTVLAGAATPRAHDAELARRRGRGRRASAAGRRRATSARARRRPCRTARVGVRRAASGVGRDRPVQRGGARRVPASPPPARAPNTSPSSSELLARRLAPCTPVQATSPAANRLSTDVRPSQVGLDAAHHVVGGRADRNRIGGQIEPDAAARLRDRRKRACARSRDRRAPSTGRPGAPVAICSRTMARATTIARRQIAGRVVALRRSARPPALSSRPPSPRSASDNRNARRAGDARAPSDGTARTRDRRRARRPRTPSPCRRRSPPPGWWSRGTPDRRRRSPAACAWRRPRAPRPRPIDERGARADAVARRAARAPSPRRARARAATSTRGSTARGRSRGRWRRGRAAHGARCARPRVRAPARRSSSRSKAAPQSSSSRHVARAVAAPARRRPRGGTGRRPPPSCRGRGAPESRRGRPPRRRRPARSRCCSRADRPW